MDKVFLFLQVFLLAAIAKAQWPCPAETDIAPCICSFDGVDLDLDCSQVANDGQLVEAFSAVFPFTKFRNFTIIGESDANPVKIMHFNVDLFGEIYFEHVYIMHTTLETMDGDPFAKSQNLLQSMQITNNKLTTYPFDTLQNYLLLTSLRLNNNQIGHMADIISSSLLTLIVNNNPDLKYGDTVFYNAPTIRTLALQNTGQTNIAPNMFRYIKKLRNLNLSGNTIHILWKGSFWFESDILVQVTINSNTLDTIEAGAIGFCDPSPDDSTICNTAAVTVPKFIMKNNFLTDLPEDVWKETFDLAISNNDPDTFTVDFTDNPIRCGCNIGWLVIDAGYKGLVVPESTCDNGDTFADLDQAFFEAMCKSPSTVPPSVK